MLPAAVTLRAVGAAGSAVTMMGYPMAAATGHATVLAAATTAAVAATTAGAAATTAAATTAAATTAAATTAAAALGPKGMAGDVLHHDCQDGLVRVCFAPILHLAVP